MSVSKEDVKEFLKNMPVHELLGFVKELETDWGVSAAAPMAMMAAPAAAAVDAGPTVVSVILVSSGDKKVGVIKVVRELTGLGLKEAKDLVDAAPKAIKEGLEKKDAEAIKAKLEEAGAVVEIK